MKNYNRIQTIAERDRIYTLYHAGKINGLQAARLLRAVDGDDEGRRAAIVLSIVLTLFAGVLLWR